MNCSFPNQPRNSLLITNKSLLHDEKKNQEINQTGQVCQVDIIGQKKPIYNLNNNNLNENKQITEEKEIKKVNSKPKKKKTSKSEKELTFIEYVRIKKKEIEKNEEKEKYGLQCFQCSDSKPHLFPILGCGFNHYEQERIKKESRDLSYLYNDDKIDMFFTKKERQIQSRNKNNNKNSKNSSKTNQNIVSNKVVDNKENLKEKGMENSMNNSELNSVSPNPPFFY